MVGGRDTAILSPLQPPWGAPAAQKLGEPRALERVHGLGSLLGAYGTAELGSLSQQRAERPPTGSALLGRRLCGAPLPQKAIFEGRPRASSPVLPGTPGLWHLGLSLTSIGCGGA